MLAVCSSTCIAHGRGVSELDSGSSGPGLSPGGDMVLCSWARHLNLAAPLSNQVYKWVNLAFSATADLFFDLLIIYCITCTYCKKDIHWRNRTTTR